MKKTIEYMTEKEVLSIPEADLPLMVLSSHATNFFAFGIMLRRKSVWNHFMWMHKPGMLASQDIYYKEINVSKYFGYDRRLKFWHNPNWNTLDKIAIQTKIKYWLDQPKFRTRYDFMAIAGQALGLFWFQNPATRICSDYGSILCESCVDIRYDLKYPAPDQVDTWLNNHSEYTVYGRYAGE